MLTHWGREKTATVWQTMISNAFSWMKMYEFSLKFHWSLFLRFQSKIFQHWFTYWLGAVQATSHYLNQWWLVYWCIYTSLGLNELNMNVIFDGWMTSGLINWENKWMEENCFVTLTPDWSHFYTLSKPQLLSMVLHQTETKFSSRPGPGLLRNFHVKIHVS